MAETLRFTLDGEKFRRMCETLGERDVRIAATWALNDTALEVLTDLQLRLPVVFDRPTRFTINAFHVRGARPANLEATLEQKEKSSGRHYLRVQETGGTRPQTGLEKRLTLAAPEGAYAVIPTAAARLDAYGNWSTGERNQVMSQLRVGRDVGYMSNQTNRSAERHARRGTAQYFVPQNGGLSPGIYKRKQGAKPVMVAAFTDHAPKYEPRLNFYDEIEREFYTRLPDHLSRTIAKMVTRRSA